MRRRRERPQPVAGEATVVDACGRVVPATYVPVLDTYGGIPNYLGAVRQRVPHRARRRRCVARQPADHRRASDLDLISRPRPR